MNPVAQPDLRYPIGRFSDFAAQSPRSRHWCIDQLRTAASLYSAAVKDFSQAQINKPYREGGWTVRQVIHHVADSHMNSYVRFKLALTEIEPVIKPYDEAAWAELADSAGPVDTSLLLIDSLHTRWVALLESMSEEQWARTYRHPERGLMSLEQTALLYAWHTLHHLAHIQSIKPLE